MGRSAKTKVQSFLTVLWLALGLATHAVLAEDDFETATMPSDILIAEADRALDLYFAGKSDEAYSLLFNVNRQTQLENNYAPDVLRYPNLVFVRYFQKSKDYDQAISFAVSIASAMNTETHRDHPYRIEANARVAMVMVEQRQYLEAYPLLSTIYQSLQNRDDLNGLKLEVLSYLIRAAHGQNTGDILAFFDAFRDLQKKTPDSLVTRADVFYIDYLYVDTLKKTIQDRKQVAGESTKFINKVEQSAHVPQDYLEYYRGFHGLILRRAGENRAALPYLRSYHEYLTRQSVFNFDYFNNAVHFVTVVHRIHGTKDALAIVQEVIEAGENHATGDHTLALFYMQKGIYQKRLDDPKAQATFRKAYSVARRSLEQDASVVNKLKSLIDLDDPGMKGFELAHEFGVVDTSEFRLDPDGETVIRMFFEGKYLTLNSMFEQTKAEYSNRAALYYINLALYQALRADYFDSQETLALARRLNRTSLNSGLDQNSPIFDFVDLLGKVIITIREMEKADGALARLKARYNQLTLTQKRFYLAALLHFQNSFALETAAQATAYRYLDLPEVEGELAGWDMLAKATAVYNLNIILSEDDLKKEFATALQQVENHPDLKLYRRWLEFTQLLVTPASLRREDALTKISAYNASFLRMLPDHYALITNTQLQMSYALQWQHRMEESLIWIERAVKSMNGGDGAREDTLAFLLSVKVNILLQMKDYDRALATARSAYDLANKSTTRATMLSGVLEAYARAIFYKTEDAEQAAAVLKRHIDDPAFLNSLNGINRYTILRVYAEYISNYATTEESIAALNRAQKTLDSDNNHAWDYENSLVLFAKARILYWDNQLASAYEEITKSSNIYFGFVDRSVGSSKSGTTTKDSFAESLAIHEAAIGWDLAQTLSD